jgi:glycosyltransferase involved in cell wall biosynthesis
MKIKKMIFKAIFFFLILSIIKIKILSNIKFLLSYIESKNEIKKNEKFLKFCNNNPKKIKIYKEIINPKISIISPIYNRERYLIRFLKSIQNQNFQNIEIILIDDYSIDKSVNIINEYKKIDQRIKLIKNLNNKGTFVSRNIGVLYSKGKYLIIPDPDDIISKDIINICYKYAKKENYDIIRFNMYNSKGKITLFQIVNKLNNSPKYQPDISLYLFYGSNELDKIDYHICNKFISKDAYIRALNSINIEYLSKYIIYRDDSIINYLLYRTSRSYLFIKNIGYYYTINSLSVTNNLFSMSNLRIKFAFIFLNIIFEYSKKSKYEKDMFNFLFTIFNKKFNIEQKISAFTHNSTFYYNIINMYLGCRYLTRENKIILEKYKKIIKKN